jgi:iron complex outermembrane receptor protein
MIKTRLLCHASVLAACAAMAAPARAENASSQEVVVTGSLIASGRTTQALPVAVVSSTDLLKQGSPTVTELIKKLPSSSAVFGDANQFGAGRTEGSATVNLRTLGSSRTLVLLNGRRMPTSSAALGGAPFVDLNVIPQAAIGRLEVLKDGAAATYGSDAIAGVTNFITKTGMKGFEVGGDYSAIKGSGGDWRIWGDAGWSGGPLSAFVAVDYQHRSELDATDRPFTAPPFGTDFTSELAAYNYNPGNGGWSSAANPGTFLNPAAGFANVVDPGCPGLGGEITANNATGLPQDFTGVPGLQRCLWRYVDWDHLVEKMDLVEVYGEVNLDLGEKTRLHVEGLYARADVPRVAQSVTYGPNQYPGANSLTQPGTILPYYFIPATNPGLVALKAAFPTAPIANSPVGLYAHPFFWRPMAVGGNPLFGSDAQQGRRANRTFRVNADLAGELDALGGLRWDAAVTYGESKADNTTPDFLVDRLELALRGLGSKAGGSACDYTVAANAGNASAGCFWFNPFSSSIARNPLTGAANPNYASATANDPALIDWIYGPDSQRSITYNRILVLDGTVNGDTRIHLPGGDVQWAVGFQYRRQTYDFQPQGFTNQALYPCVDSILNGATNCAIKNGPYTFYGNYAPALVTSTATAEFAELRLPFLEGLEGSAAIRHEDLGAAGSTWNPKGSLRWQATDWLAFRGSVGTTFRAPPGVSLVPNGVTLLAFTPQTTSYKPYDTFGNPNLKPESATTYNVGAILTGRGFTATLDYWRFDFDNPILNESGLDLVSTFFTAATNPAGCASPLAVRITFATGVCSTSAASFSRVKVFTINGPPINTSGLDFSLRYSHPDLFMDTDLQAGLDGTYTIEYAVGAVQAEGVTITPAFEAAGKLNYLKNNINSIPKWKGSAYLEFNHGPHTLRVVGNYLDGMHDSRFDAAALAAPGTPAAKGNDIKSWTTFDIHYSAKLPWQTTLKVSVVNAFDADPPFARLDYSYDPFTANPLGRVVKVGAIKRF